MQLRYSALETLRNPAYGCPRRFYHHYILQKERPSYEKDIGKAVHDVIKRWHRDPALNVELAAWQEAMKHETLKLGDAADAVEEVLIMFRAFKKRFQPDPGAQVYVERTLKVQFGQNGDAFTGTPDYVAVYPNGLGRLLDYKTGRLKQEDTMQMKVYAWLGSLHYGYKECRAERMYLRSEEETEPEVFGPGDFAEAQKWVREGFKEVRARLQKDDFPPRPNRFCAHCLSVLDCPAAPDVDLPFAKPENDEEVQRLAGQYLVLEARLDRMKEFLKEHIKNSGPVEACGVVFDFHQSEPGKTVEDLGAFHKLLVDKGLDPWEYFNVDGRSLKKLIRQDLPGLAPLLAEKPGRRTFGWKPAEDRKAKTA